MAEQKQAHDIMSTPILIQSPLFLPEQPTMSQLGPSSAVLSTDFPVGKHRQLTMGKKSKAKQLSIERKKHIAKNKKKRQLLDLKLKRDNDKKCKQQDRAKARDDKKKKK